VHRPLLDDGEFDEAELEVILDEVEPWDAADADAAAATDGDEARAAAAAAGVSRRSGSGPPEWGEDGAVSLGSAGEFEEADSADEYDVEFDEAFEFEDEEGLQDDELPK
jgi:hypothetical protein